MGEIISRLSHILINICDPAGNIIGAYIAIRGAKAGINAIIKTIIIGPISNSS
jgi:hypothetical protein